MRALFWLSVAVWIGTIVFFSFIVAPTMFVAVPRETAGAVLAILFPRYYAFGATVGAISVATAALVWRRAPARGWPVVTLLLVVMLVTTVYAGGVVEPRARALRPALHAEDVDASAQSEFDRLHRLAVELNGAVLLLGVVTICIAANLRPPPR